MLSLKQLKDVCLMDDNTSNRCKYLSQDENDSSKYFCLKLSSKGREIDEEIESYLNDIRKRGRDPRKDNLPLGDNCPGYPVLRNIEQGYDHD
jgi:hypothetical protein